MNGRDLAVVLIAGGILLILAFVIYRPWVRLGAYVRMPMMGYGMGFGILLVPLLVLVVGVLGAIAFGRREHGMRWSDRSNALEIIRERYAKGEITKEQYEQLKKDLEY
jgi:putative membrane protein